MRIHAVEPSGSDIPALVPIKFIGLKNLITPDPALPRVTVTHAFLREAVLIVNGAIIPEPIT